MPVFLHPERRKLLTFKSFLDDYNKAVNSGENIPDGIQKQAQEIVDYISNMTYDNDAAIKIEEVINKYTKYN